MYVGGAHADIFINGTLINFKCTKDRGYKWHDFAQLVSYFILSIIDVRSGEFGIHESELAISRLAIYKGRYGEIEYVDTYHIDKSKLEKAIYELQKLWFKLY